MGVNFIVVGFLVVLEFFWVRFENDNNYVVFIYLININWGLLWYCVKFRGYKMLILCWICWFYFCNWFGIINYLNIKKLVDI